MSDSGIYYCTDSPAINLTVISSQGELFSLSDGQIGDFISFIIGLTKQETKGKGNGRDMRNEEETKLDYNKQNFTSAWETFQRETKMSTFDHMKGFLRTHLKCEM